MFGSFCEIFKGEFESRCSPDQNPVFPGTTGTTGTTGTAGTTTKNQRYAFSKNKIIFINNIINHPETTFGIQTWIPDDQKPPKTTKNHQNHKKTPKTAKTSANGPNFSRRPPGTPKKQPQDTHTCSKLKEHAFHSENKLFQPPLLLQS